MPFQKHSLNFCQSPQIQLLTGICNDDSLVYVGTNYSIVFNMEKFNNMAGDEWLSFITWFTRPSSTLLQ